VLKKLEAKQEKKTETQARLNKTLPIGIQLEDLSSYKTFQSEITEVD
jgi:hypothetical protein